MTYAVETCHLSKTIDDSPILNHITMGVKQGEIYGFLGANGAGKTSLMKTLYHIITPDAGTITLLGERVEKGNHPVFSRIGSIIESPVFYQHLSARENLELHCGYMGGMPEELVFDQDSIVCVSENAGDIIYTYEFEKFRQECGLSIRMCRGADPESKGKIENVVKYIKGNFLSHRLYVDDGILNGSCLEWLERTANAKVHGTTKLVPAEVFQEEREYLRPLPVCDQVKRPVICRTVRKDNTIIYDSNRYSVPLGTYTTQPEVRIETLDGVLYIQTLFGEPICEHRISSGRGLLIQSQSHRRDRTSKLDKLLEELDAELDGRATEFLTAIRVDKSRYARDQFRLIQSLLDQYGKEAVLQAIGFCQRSRLYSANTMRDYLEHQAALSRETRPAPAIPAIPVDDPKYHVTTQKRPLSAYAKVGDPRC